MTDLEATRLCAEAMGIHGVHEWEGKIYGRRPYYMLGLPSLYDPLHDDAQCMALVKRFGLDMEWFFGFSPVPAVIVSGGKFASEKTCDLNRAVVYCVAKMQAAKK